MADDRPRNAFERAREAALAFHLSWWDAIEIAIEKAVPGATISKPQHLWFGDNLTVFGPQLLERRMITLPKKGHKKPRSWTITRATTIRFSMLPSDELEEIARGLLEQSDAEWREANLANVIKFAQSLSGEEGLEIARMALGNDASEAELKAYAASIVPKELLEGGDAAAKFFDEAISVVGIDEDEEGNPVLMPEPPPPPGVHPLDVGEWDFYSPEELAHYDGPESDPAYAFRIVRLSEAMRADPDRAIHIAMLLGAITREWELWRENEEFLRAGREHFAEQSRLARSKREKPWMAHVRADFDADNIGPNIAAYARRLHQRRDLQPPTTERIRNFVSDLRKRQKPGAITIARHS